MRPASPPAAGPSRVVVTSNKPIQTKKSRPQRELSPIDLVSEDESPEPFEQRRMEMSPKAAAMKAINQAADARTRRPDVPNRGNREQFEMHGAPHSAKRKRSPSESSSTNAQVDGQDEIEEFDDSIIHVKPQPISTGPPKRARMQDKNGNSSVSAQSRAWSFESR